MPRGKSHANGNGNSFANGAPPPSWLRHNWELREALATRYCLWTVMA